MNPIIMAILVVTVIGLIGAVILFAAVDNVVSDAEAAFVNTCADALSALCEEDGLAPARPGVRADDFITRRPVPAQKPDKQPGKDEDPAPEPEKLEDLFNVSQVFDPARPTPVPPISGSM